MLIVIALVGCEWLATDPLDVPYESTQPTNVTTGPSKGPAMIGAPGERRTADPNAENQDEPRWNPVRVPKEGEVKSKKELLRTRNSPIGLQGTPTARDPKPGPGDML